MVRFSQLSSVSLVILLIFILSLDLDVCAVSEKQNYTYQTKWFTQQVDHFSFANTDTFKQKYLVNTDHWCGKNCPILFYVGHDGPIGHVEAFANENTGWMFENAKSLQAMIVFAEHRFYGDSTPYQLDTRKPSPALGRSLGYLTTEQALADYAMLIYELKNTLYEEGKKSPVIGISGGYGGFLSAWFRMKYPNTILGTLASAAAIFQFPGQVDCAELSKIVTEDYAQYSSQCTKSISKSWSAMIELATTSPTGLQKLSEIFNTCKPLSADGIPQFIELMGTVWYFSAMNDYPHESNYYSKLPAYPLRQLCSVLDQDPDQFSTEQLLEKISKAMQVFTNNTGQLSCLDTDYFFFPRALFDYQLCTEMIVPHGGNGPPDDMFFPFPFNQEKYVERCREVWGVEAQVGKVQALYHDTDLSQYSNIIFSSGTRDPYYASSPRESIEANGIHAVIIPGATFMEDLRASGPNDTEHMKNARKEEVDIIRGWIEKYYDDNKSLFTTNYNNYARDEL